MDALSHAARLFEKDGRSISRAGRAYDTLGGRALAEGDLVGALAHFTKARDAFERGSDGYASLLDSAIESSFLFSRRLFSAVPCRQPFKSPI